MYFWIAVCRELSIALPRLPWVRMPSKFMQWLLIHLRGLQHLDMYIYCCQWDLRKLWRALLCWCVNGFEVPPCISTGNLHKIKFLICLAYFDQNRHYLIPLIKVWGAYDLWHCIGVLEEAWGVFCPIIQQHDSILCSGWKLLKNRNTAN